MKKREMMMKKNKKIKKLELKKKESMIQQEINNWEYDKFF